MNGRPASKTAERLIGRDYADRALASLGDSRTIDSLFIRRAIGEFDPDHVTMTDRKRMRQDPTIKMGMWYTKATMIKAENSMECKDPVIAAAMDEIYGAVHATIMKTILCMFDYGFQAGIKEYELGKLDATFVDSATGQERPVWEDTDILPVVIGDLIPLPVETTKVKLDHGRYDGLTTPLARKPGSTHSDENTDHVPAEWTLWFANEFEEEHRNWYGRARIDPAYRAWWSFWFNWFNRDRNAEMDADPALQVWYPPGSMATGEVDGNNQPIKRNNRDVALEIGAALRGGATIAWPSDVHVADDGKVSTQRLWEAAFLTGGENLAAFGDLLNDLRLEKLRACLVPEEALTEALRGTGSRATSGNRVEIFIEGLEQAMQYVDDRLNKYLIRPVVEANWGKDAPACKKVTTGFQEEDLTLTTTLIEAAFTADPNALPIDFEELMRRANVPMLPPEEQEEKDREAEEAEAAKPPPMLPPGPPGVNGGPPMGQAGMDPQALMASQERARKGPRKYERERILLLGQKLDSTAPGWARREAKRRDANVQAISERLREVAVDLYGDMFETAAQALEDTPDLQLGVADVVSSLYQRIKNAITSRIDSWRQPLVGEHASMYHAAGAAELARLGLSAESWDVGRDDVQTWATEHAGELIKTIDSSIVESYIRPWLTSALMQAGYGDAPTGVPVSTMELAAQLRDKFANYPQWMAERLVRTESMRGYNLSAADMWERVGVTEVEEYDGLGGKSGKTDAECLARNGRVVPIDQFRQDTLDEHPNGTLGAVPVTVDVELRPVAPSLVHLNASVGGAMYVVSSDGLILSETATGRLLAGDD